jgi:hypothetical protein
MTIFLFIIALSVLGGIAFLTVESFLREKVGNEWWVVFSLFVLVGAVAGVWFGFMFDYHVSPTLRFAGFPLPMAMFHLEEGTWVDFVHDTPVMILIGVADATAVALCFALPVSAAFYIRQLLRRKKLAVGS